jgi:hypothetical protein
VSWQEQGAQGADVFVQRYDANLSPLAHDSDLPLNNLVTQNDQTTPAIAGTAAAGGSYVVAWIDQGSGHVRGRVLDGTTGFDFNPVTGTTDEFQASLTGGPIRENPAVAIGGSQPWIAIGWDVGGVVSVRRFPTITQSPP